MRLTLIRDLFPKFYHSAPNNLHYLLDEVIEALTF